MARLKTYKGFPHGMPTTEADTINADLLEFFQETVPAREERELTTAGGRA